MYKIILAVTLFLLLSSCMNFSDGIKSKSNIAKPVPGLFSKDVTKGINLSKLMSGENNNNSTSLNVNAYLWRASLNIVSIAPLISVDAFGGTIISDWYINKKNKKQRLKITAFVLSRELRSDGIKVKVHIQNLNDNNWSETFLDNKLANKIEENILNEARNLRISSLNKK